MGFAKKVAHRVIFMDKGLIVEDERKEDFFANPRSERAREFSGEDPALTVGAETARGLRFSVTRR